MINDGDLAEKVTLPCLSAFDNYFLAAQTLREQLKHEMDSIFIRTNPLRRHEAISGDDDSQISPTATGNGVDVLLFPSAISAAPTLQEAERKGSGTEVYVQDVLTVPASLAGLPAASCPVQVEESSSQLPIGVQVASQWGDDELVLDVAELLEA